MQGLGFASAVSPALDELYGDEKKRREALKRHLVFYNAHPYITSPILGAVISMEENSGGTEEGAARAARFKSAAMAPYSAIGDSFFWGSIRPLASCIGILISLFFGLWGPVVFLVFYNLFHLWMRWMGLTRGYALGEKVVGYIKSLELPARALKAKYAATALTGLLTAALATGLARTEGRPGAAAFSGVIVFIAAAFILNLLMKKGLSVPKIIYLVVPPLIILGATGVLK
jgi:PTS system mannose-specific IID component